MQTDLAHHIQQIRMVDTHEHLQSESEWLDAKPDILQDLFAWKLSVALLTLLTRERIKAFLPILSNV